MAMEFIDLFAHLAELEVQKFFNTENL